MSGAATQSGQLILAGNSLGNPQDIPLRSRDYLKTADLVVFESDKGARMALKTAGIHRTYEVLSEHREAQTMEVVGQALSLGKTVLYMSDQGVPTLADPGKDVLKVALALGAAVKVVPGPSSITVALSAWPNRLEQFHYIGFPPADKEQRKPFLAGLTKISETMVVLDTPYRLGSLLDDCLQIFGETRKAMLALDISGPEEAFHYGVLPQLKNLSLEITAKRLNFVLVLEGAFDDGGGMIRGSSAAPMAGVKGRGRFVKRRR